MEHEVLTCRISLFTLASKQLKKKIFAVQF